jgi:hypothetical protein
MDGNIDATAATLPAAAAQTAIACGGGHHPVADDTAPISRIVAQVAAQCPGERISLGEMAEAFGDRAFGLLILVLLLPSLLPLMASVFGLPVLILGIQMGLGLRAPRLPAFLAQRTIARADLLRLSSASSTWLKRVEKWVKPRPGFCTSPLGDRLFGWLSAYTAIMLILPGPGTNGPPAFGNIVMALGLVEHDSRVMGLGAALTLAGCLFATGVLFFLCWVAVEAFGFFLF